MSEWLTQYATPVDTASDDWLKHYAAPIPEKLSPEDAQAVEAQHASQWLARRAFEQTEKGVQYQDDNWEADFKKLFPDLNSGERRKGEKFNQAAVAAETDAFHGFEEPRLLYSRQLVAARKLADEYLATPRGRLETKMKELRAFRASGEGDQSAIGNAMQYGVERMIPFASSMIRTANTWDIAKAAQNLNRPSATDTDFERVAGFILDQEVEGDKNIWQKVGDTVAGLPAFAAEIAATGGIYSGGKQLALQGAEKVAGNLVTRGLGRFAATNIARGVGATAAAATGLLPRTGEAAATRHLGATMEGKDSTLVEHLPAGLADTAIEVLSERFGGALGRGIANPKVRAFFSKLPGAQRAAVLKQAVVDTWLKLGPSRSLGELAKKVAEKTQWHGVLGEIAEERFGDALRAGVGLHGWEDVIPSAEQWGIEAISFSIPGAIARIAQVAAGSDGSALVPPASRARLPVPGSQAEAMRKSLADSGLGLEDLAELELTDTLEDPGRHRPIGAKEWARKNPDAATALAEKAAPSRKDFESAGLPVGSADDRKAFVERVRQQLAGGEAAEPAIDVASSEGPGRPQDATSEKPSIRLSTSWQRVPLGLKPPSGPNVEVMTPLESGGPYMVRLKPRASEAGEAAESPDVGAAAEPQVAAPTVEAMDRTALVARAGELGVAGAKGKSKNWLRDQIRQAEATLPIERRPPIPATRPAPAPPAPAELLSPVAEQSQPLPEPAALPVGAAQAEGQSRTNGEPPQLDALDLEGLRSLARTRKVRFLLNESAHKLRLKLADAMGLPRPVLKGQKRPRPAPTPEQLAAKQSKQAAAATSELERLEAEAAAVYRELTDAQKGSTNILRHGPTPKEVQRAKAAGPEREAGAPKYGLDPVLTLILGDDYKRNEVIGDALREVGRNWASGYSEDSFGYWLKQRFPDISTDEAMAKLEALRGENWYDAMIEIANAPVVERPDRGWGDASEPTDAPDVSDAYDTGEGSTDFDPNNFYAPPSRKKGQASDAQRIAKALKSLHQQYGFSATEVEPTSDDEHDALRFVRSLGLVPALVESEASFRGAHLDKSNVVLLNRSKIEGGKLWFTVGHEVAHGTKLDALDELFPPDMVAAASKARRARSKGKYAAEMDANPELLKREGVADLIGRFFQDKAFRDKLFDDSPSLWRRIVDAALKLVGRFRPLVAAHQKVLDELRARRQVLAGTSETQPMAARKSAAPQVPTAAIGTNDPTVSTNQIIARMSKDYGVPIRTGFLPRIPGALGVYKGWSRVVRMLSSRSGSLGVATHEVAHHIDKTSDVLTGLNWRQLGELKDLDYDPHKRRSSEGFAEYMRYYWTHDNYAQRVAPEFTKHFEAWLASKPELAKKVGRTKAQIDQWRNTGAMERGKATISDTGKPERPAGESTGEYLRERMGYQLNRQYQLWKAAGHPYSQFDKAAESLAKEQGKSFDKFEGSHELFKLLDQKAPAFAERAIHDGVFRLTGNMETIGPSLKESLSSISDADYLEFRTFAKALHTKDMYAAGLESDMTRDDADAIVAQGKKNPAWVKAAAGLTSYGNALLDMAVDAGSLSKASADRMKAKWPHYVPMDRVLDLVDAMPRGMGRKLFSRPQLIKRLFGSGKQTLDPVDGLIKRTIRFIDDGNKQQVANAVINTANEIEGLGWWAEKIDPRTVKSIVRLGEIIPQLKALVKAAGHNPSIIDDLDPLDAVFLFRPDLMVGTNGKPIVRHIRNGETKLYYLDPDMYRAAQSMERGHLNLFLTIAQTATTIQKFGLTGVNWMWNAVNFAKDYPQYLFGKKYGRDTPLQLVKPIEWTARYVAFSVAQKFGSYVPSTIKAGMSNLVPERVKSNFKIGNDTIRAWKALGGELSTSLGVDKSRITAAREDLIQTPVLKKALRVFIHPIRSGHRVLDTARGILGFTEVGPRLAEFEAALRSHKVTGSDVVAGRVDRAIVAEASNAAADVTVNFGRLGPYGRVANMIFPYWNAATEGADKAVRTIRDNPKRTLVALSALAAYTVARWFSYRDDDWRKEAPGWLKYGYDTLSDKDGKPLVRVQRNDTFGKWFAGGLESILDAIYEKDPKAIYEWEAAVAKPLLDKFNPFVLWREPAIYRPILEDAANWDYFLQRPIVPESVADLKPGDQASPYNTKTMKTIGAWLGISPARLEHLVEGYSGGLYRRTVKPIENVASGKLSDNDADIPVIGRFFFRHDYSASTPEFYRYRDELSREAASALRKAKTEKGDGKLTLDDAVRLGYIDQATADAHRKAEDSAGLIKELTRLAGDETDREKRFVYEKYTIGLSRTALNKKPLARYPNPLAAKNLPADVQEVRDKFLGRKLWEFTDPQPRQTKGETGDAFRKRQENAERELARAKAALDGLSLEREELNRLLLNEAKRRGNSTVTTNGRGLSAFGLRQNALVRIDAQAGGG